MLALAKGEAIYIALRQARNQRGQLGNCLPKFKNMLSYLV